MAPNVTELNHLVMASKIAELFGKSKLTISLWRKKRALPYVIIPGDSRPSIRFDLNQVKDWAKKNNYRMRPLVDVTKTVGTNRRRILD